MAITQADIDRLDKAIVSGKLTVEVDGSRVTYRSMAELMVARDHAVKLVGGGSAASGSGLSVVSFERS
ncbi:phage head-tail joining protein [Paramagnetospirillum magneticum]|uniref:Uncharacterized protein n=1 Tax=Paramagnetospirillum magneticum (strain ATCC 700264 / AMB-1) TaxID=342108 RepID=Q2W749_PARM1|nr:hypothetical protein [Paramagnetospirillum magneticum]BAE50326.1 hypothetical protein amb1522 [Paramagnetospirillum magneticum AMB-1]